MAKWPIIWLCYFLYTLWIIDLMYQCFIQLSGFSIRQIDIWHSTQNVCLFSAVCVIINRYYTCMTLDFHTNKIFNKISIIASKTAQNCWICNAFDEECSVGWSFWHCNQTARGIELKFFSIEQNGFIEVEPDTKQCWRPQIKATWKTFNNTAYSINRRLLMTIWCLYIKQKITFKREILKN